MLVLVLWINAAMFVVGFTSGWLSRSTALLADSLDMLGDASVYAVSLYILHRAARTQAKASLFKGIVMFAFGLGVIAEALHKALSGVVTPAADVMGVIGLLALAANALCFYLLYSHRADNLNMRSTWLCSRNDVIANMSVLFAGGLVAWTGSFWPDLLVGLAIAALFLTSAWKVLSESLHVLKGRTPPKSDVPLTGE